MCMVYLFSPLTRTKRCCLMLNRHNCMAEVGAAMLHNEGTNIQAKQMTHFLTAQSLQR